MERHRTLLIWARTAGATTSPPARRSRSSLSLATLPIGLVVGFFVALGKQSPDRLIRLAAEIYTTIFRGLPELLTLFLVYYGGPVSASRGCPCTSVNRTPPSRSTASRRHGGAGLVLSAYASEVFLSAFRGHPAGPV